MHPYLAAAQGGPGGLAAAAQQGMQGFALQQVQLAQQLAQKLARQLARQCTNRRAPQLKKQLAQRQGE
jgi:hypothetical protein